MKKACLLMVLLIICAAFPAVAAETLDAPVICTWEDNKTSAVSIRIDDGIYNSAVVYNQLQKNTV